MLKLITVLFTQHKKHLPAFIERTPLAELLRYGFSIFVSAWVFQGMLYMDKREALFKILLDLCILSLLLLIGLSFWSALLIAHSLNFAFNGQWFAMYTHMGATNITPEKYLSYIVGMQSRIERCAFIQGAAAYGSLSKGVYKSTSDMDIRIIPRSGVMNWFRAVIWAFKERVYAFLCGFPLDMYLFDLDVIKSRMRIDEPPIVLVNHGNILDKAYKDIISFVNFTHIFDQKNCKKVNEI